MGLILVLLTLLLIFLKYFVHDLGNSNISNLNHTCFIEYGDTKWGANKLSFDSSHVFYGNMSTGIGEDPIILNDTPFPFKFELKSLPAYEASNAFGFRNSFTGMILKIEISIRWLSYG